MCWFSHHKLIWRRDYLHDKGILSRHSIPNLDAGFCNSIQLEPSGFHLLSWLHRCSSHSWKSVSGISTTWKPQLYFECSDLAPCHPSLSLGGTDTPSKTPSAISSSMPLRGSLGACGTLHRTATSNRSISRHPTFVITNCIIWDFGWVKWAYMGLVLSINVEYTNHPSMFWGAGCLGLTGTVSSILTKMP